MIKVAKGIIPAELVLKNGHIINVFDGLIEEADVAIEDGIIVGIGEYSGVKEIDVKHQFIAPGFIDGHVHIESSMLTPPQFAKIIMPWGTTSIIADPHEIANVSGIPGIKYMMESSKTVPLEVFIMIPSCVPVTPFETSGGVISARDIESLKNVDHVLGLGEVMDYPGVLAGETSILDKIAIMKSKTIDGHAPEVTGKALNAYASMGIRTDHECASVEELKERVKRGMYVHLREGSATRNVRELLKGITPNNYSRLLFCTDDKHSEDIRIEGHINFNVNLAIEYGISPIVAIQMATINTATCYGIKHLGAIAPSYQADLVVFSDLTKIKPSLVFKKGVLVAKNSKALFEAKPYQDGDITDSVKVLKRNGMFDLPLTNTKVKVIGLIENNVTTTKQIETVSVEHGTYVQEDGTDLLKVAVVERHKKSGNVGVGLVKGYGLKGGAVAMTIAHDSHNLIVVGDSDADMERAVDEIIKISGGIVLVSKGEVLESLPLEVGGIMTTKDAKFVEAKLNHMEKVMRRMGLNEKIDDPFLSLGFLSLTVIPELKLTDQGLFDVTLFKIVPIEE